MKEIKIGIVGLGTIGSGVYEAIQSNGALIKKKTGVSLVVKSVCDKDEKALEAISSGGSLVKSSSYKELISDAEIDIIVELIGGVNPAKDVILSALNAKKHVVTANKALLSESWKEVFTCASENKKFVNFEASVGGAIPIIRTLRASLVANNLSTIYGIVNGTTNFILTMMEEKGCSFDGALKIAQEKGIAEPDPDLDISGKDSAHKLSILALLGFGFGASPSDVYTEGICDIGPEDIQNARKWGYSIKLLAIAKDGSDGVQLRVHPTLLRSSHLLSDVKGADNAIFAEGDLVGDSLVFGRGAGKKPTSSSVVSDIVEIAKNIVYYGGENTSGYDLDYAKDEKSLSKIESLKTSYYFRFSAIDKPGVLAGISSILSDNEISIANVAQEERNEGETVPVIILTHKAEEGNMRKAIDKIDKLDYVSSKTVVIRIED